MLDASIAHPGGLPTRTRTSAKERRPKSARIYTADGHAWEYIKSSYRRGRSSSCVTHDSEAIRHEYYTGPRLSRPPWLASSRQTEASLAKIPDGHSNNLVRLHSLVRWGQLAEPARRARRLGRYRRRLSPLSTPAVSPRSRFCLIPHCLPDPRLRRDGRRSQRGAPQGPMQRATIVDGVFAVQPRRY